MISSGFLFYFKVVYFVATLWDDALTKTIWLVCIKYHLTRFPIKIRTINTISATTRSICTKSPPISNENPNIHMISMIPIIVQSIHSLSFIIVLFVFSLHRNKYWPYSMTPNCFNLIMFID